MFNSEVHHSPMRWGWITLGTWEEVGRTAPKVCGRGADGLTALGMLWKSGTEISKSVKQRVAVVSASALEGMWAELLTLRADTLSGPARTGAELSELTGGIVRRTILSLSITHKRGTETL